MLLAHELGQPVRGSGVLGCCTIPYCFVELARLINCQINNENIDNRTANLTNVSPYIDYRRLMPFISESISSRQDAANFNSDLEKKETFLSSELARSGFVQAVRGYKAENNIHTDV